MADIKFHCPECRQKIAVDAAGAGLKIDCPRCRSGLVIPPTDEAPVEVTMRRKLAVLAGSADDVYAELEKKQRDLEAAQAGAEKTRGELTSLQAELASATSERDALRKARTEADRMRGEEERLKAELAQVRQERDALKTQAAAKPAVLPPPPKALTPRVVVATPSPELEKLRADLAVLTQERDTLKAQAAAKPAVLPPPPKALTPKVVAPSPDLEKLRAEVAALTKERDALKAESAAKLAEALERVEKRNQSVEEMRAKLAGPNPLQPQVETLRAANADAQVQLADLRKQLAALTAERATLQTQVAAPNALLPELNALREKSGELRTELDGVKNQLVMTSAERDAARKRLEELDTVKAEAQSELAGGRKQIATLTAERDEARKQLGAFSAERDEARRSLATREQAQQETLLAAENTRKEAARLKTDNVNMSGERERLKTQLAEATTKLKDLQQRVDGLREALQSRDRDGGEAAKAELETVQQALAEKEAALAELKKKNLAQLGAAAATAREAMKTATASLEARLATAETEGRRAAAEAEMQRQQLETMRSERNDAAKRVGAIEAQLHERDTEYKRAKESEKTLQEKLVEAERLAHAAREMTQNVATERDRLTIDLGRLRTELGTVGEDLRKARVECDKLRANAGPPDPEHEQLRKAEAERDTLKAELEAVKSGLERTKQHVNVLQTRRDQMRDEIARLKVALGQAPDAVS